jgi:hypothetical protein
MATTKAPKPKYTVAGMSPQDTGSDTERAAADLAR